MWESLAFVAGSLIGAVVCFGLLSFFGNKKLVHAEQFAFDIVEKAKLVADEREKSALAFEQSVRQQAQSLLEEVKQEEKTTTEKLTQLENRLEQRREQLEERWTEFLQRESSLEHKKTELHDALQDIEKQKQVLKDMLFERANMTEQEARSAVTTAFEQEMQETFRKRLAGIEQDAIKHAKADAAEVIGTAIQRLASSVVAETTVSIVQIPNEEMKGRIIGREGRNIQAFEQMTGVDVIIDDTPNTIVLSCFDLVRRSIAKIALENLIADGRIHPTRIEEMVQTATESVDAMMLNYAEAALSQLGITGIHPDLYPWIGRLAFRTSFGQNILKHSVECAYLAEHMAREIGADPYLAKMGAFFHDLWKSMTHESQESHVSLGAELARRYGLPEQVVNAIEAHHEDVPFTCVEAMLAAAADAISAARPGARRESIDSYLKRLREMEQLVKSFDGVRKVYAVQAGREIRIMVDPLLVDDVASVRLARDIAEKIEQTLNYPGSIKVQVVRETRSIEFAR